VKILLLKDKKINEELSIQKGNVFNVRQLQYKNLLGNTIIYFQIIDVDSPFLGEDLPFEYCIETKEVPNKDLIDQKENAQKLVKKLTEQINKKNKKIETLTFFVDTLSITLEMLHKEITKLKDLEKA
jgi:peptidoglycan hydrolase CwlO-like protein